MVQYFSPGSSQVPSGNTWENCMCAQNIKQDGLHLVHKPVLMLTGQKAVYTIWQDPPLLNHWGLMLQQTKLFLQNDHKGSIIL